MHQAADELSRFYTKKDEHQFGKELPLLATDHVVNANNSYSFLHSRDEGVAIIDSIKANTDKPTHDAQIPGKLISAQKKNLFSWKPALQVSHARSECSINSNKSRIWQSTVSGAKQI